MDEVMERMESLLSTNDSPVFCDSLNGRNLHRGGYAMDDVISSPRKGRMENSQMFENDSGLGNTWTLPTKLNSTLTSPQVSRLQDDQLMSRSPGIYTPPRSISSESPNLRSYPNTRLSHNMRPSQDMTRPSQDFRTSPDIRTSHEIRTSHDIRTSHEIQATLHESEARRELLTHKLKDARDTIHMQSQKLFEIESASRENDLALRELTLKEKEYKKHLCQLEKQKQAYQTYRLESFRTQEQLQEKVESLELELKSLQSQCSVLEADQKKRQEMLESTTTAITSLEEENRKLTRARDSTLRELSTLKDSVDLAKNRNDWLESHNKELRQELAKLKEENREQCLQIKEANMQVNEQKSANQQLKDESKQLIQTLQMAREESKHRRTDIENLQALIADIKADLASVAADKERFFQEKLDLHQKVQNLMHEKEKTDQERVSVDLQMSELQVELNQVRMEKDKKEHDCNSLSDELKAVKKVGEVLSVELANTKTSLEKAEEQMSSLEHSKKLALQQHTLYEQEVKTLDTQLENTKKQLETAKKDLQKEKDIAEEQILKLKEELRHTRTERNQLETKCLEHEARLQQSEQNLREHSAMQQAEINSWKTSCEKLTASLSKKELDLQTHIKRVQDLEDETGLLKVNHNTYQNQYQELVESREQSLRLQDENRRLLQERAENQQVIQLLEMQKSILQKASEGSLSKVHAKEELQCQYDQLYAEHQVLQDKVKGLEKIRDDLIREKEDRLAKTGLFSESKESTFDTRFVELEKQNKQLRDVNDMITERLSKIEKENSELKYSNQNSVNDRGLEQEKLELQSELQKLQKKYSQLEQEHQQALVEQLDRANAAESAEISSLHRTNVSLEGQVSMLEGQVLLAENGQKRAESRLECLQDEMQAKEGQRLIDSKQISTLTAQVLELQDQVKTAKATEKRLEAQVESLKEESLEDVGSELVNMKTELHKLLEVIHEKDASIEDLEGQLKTCRHQLADKDTEVISLKQQTKENNHLRSDNNVDTIANLQKEKLELSIQVTELTKERDLAEQDADDLREGLEEMQQMYDEERTKMMDKLKKDLRVKDRQIENLEEQLQAAMSSGNKKLRRGLSERRHPQPIRSVSPIMDNTANNLETLRSGLRAKMNQVTQGKMNTEDEDLVAL